MSMGDRRIWRVDGGKAVEVLIKAEAARQKQADAITAFKAEWSAESCWTRTFSGIGGIVIAEGAPIPEGWKQLKGEKPGWLCPDKRNKAGNALSERISKINALYSRDHWAAQFFDGDTWVFAGRYLIRPTWGYTGGSRTPVVIAHKDIKATPIDGLTEIKLSEFYALQGK